MVQAGVLPENHAGAPAFVEKSAGEGRRPAAPAANVEAKSQGGQTWPELSAFSALAKFGAGGKVGPGDPLVSLVKLSGFRAALGVSLNAMGER